MMVFFIKPIFPVVPYLFLFLNKGNYSCTELQQNKMSCELPTCKSICLERKDFFFGMSLNRSLKISELFFPNTVLICEGIKIKYYLKIKNRNLYIIWSYNVSNNLYLRINFYLLRTFCPHLGSFFCVLFLLSLCFSQISPLAFFRWFYR